MKINFFHKKINIRFFVKIVLLYSLLLHGNLFSISLEYIFELSGGLNFSTSNKNAVKKRFNLERLEKDITGTFHIKNGFVLFDRLLLFLSYDFSERESYVFKNDYFIFDQSSILEKIYHSLQLSVGYSIFEYSEKNNISIELGGGWVRKVHTFKTIGFISGTSDISNAIPLIPKIVNYDEGILTTGIKFYHRLVKESTLFLGFEYSLLVPSLEHFPNLVLGIDLNLELIPSNKKKLNLEK